MQRNRYYSPRSMEWASEDERLHADLRWIKRHYRSSPFFAELFARCAQVLLQPPRLFPMRRRAHLYKARSNRCGFSRSCHLLPPLVKTCAHRAKEFLGRGAEERFPMRASLKTSCRGTKIVSAAAMGGIKERRKRYVRRPLVGHCQ